MYNTIWKFQLELKDYQQIEMPTSSDILTAQIQNSYITIWALVCDFNPKEKRIFEIYGTGLPFPNNNQEGDRTHISSMQSGPAVWHLFELIKH